jgi:multidrug efflux pump subunit AcrA (membrane-fusion protein)
LQDLTQQAAGAQQEGARNAGEYRYLHLPFAGKVTVAEAKPLVEVTSQTLVVVEPERAEVTAKFDGTIKRAGIFGLDVDLPAGFTHFEATGPGIESAEAQGAVMHVKFLQRATGAFTFTITGDAIRAKPEAPLTVPVFSPHADRHEARVGVALHVSLKANTTDRGDLREEDVRNLIDLPVPKPETTPLTLGFRYRGAAKPAQVQFEPRKPRVTADVQTLFEVRETLLRHTWTLS